VADEIELIPDPAFGPGTWANWTRSIRGLEEVVVDFAVLDPLHPTQGTLLFRVVLPLRAAFELRDDLVRVMDEYSGGGTPPSE
jgi:hypothetical protein